MIPILYDSSEIAFTNNGLGRLRDCIGCVVTEERNGIYECDFEYPMNGVNFDKIQLGRIIAVKHDDTNDIQPFDIVSCSKPINGIVTFHANHVSYRQSKLTVAGTNINSLADAFTLLRTATPSNPFTYETDMVKTGYLSAANGIPRSVRQMLGGVEGSILDAYGGEYEWDGFLVRLLSARGVQRDLTIRYGVNMLEYNEETDYSGTYTAVVPYWTGGDSIIVGSVVDSGNTPYDGHSNAIPLDLTDKFENEPTTPELEAAAASYMFSNQTHLPSNSIEIQFVQLQDSNEYAQFAPLLKCELCDWVNVVFPDYKTTGQFKIVKTVYNVLLERYDSLELGKLSATLAEALGVTQSASGNSGGGGGGTAVTFYGTSTEAASTAAKTVTVDNSFSLSTGVMVTVKFSNANGVASPTLNVNGTGAISIKRYGTTAPSTSAASSWNAGSAVTFVYDGTYWIIVGWLNSTYSEISSTNATNATGSSTGLASGRRLKAAVDAFQAVSSVNGSTGAVSITASGLGITDYVTEQGTSGSWKYRKWHSGKVEAWYTGSVTFGGTTAAGSLYYADASLTIPSGIFSTAPEVIASVRSTTADALNGAVVSVTGLATSATALTLRDFRVSSATSQHSAKIRLYAWTN